MLTCSHCETQLPDEAKFCFSCGNAVENTGSADPQPNESQASTDETAANPSSAEASRQPDPATLINKIKSSNVWWMIAMITQYISTLSFGLYSLLMFFYSFISMFYYGFGYYGYYSYYYDSFAWVTYMILSGIYLIFGIATLVLAIISTVKFIKTRKLQKTALTNPAEAVKFYSSSHPIVLLVFNALFGGAFGIIASVTEFSMKNDMLAMTPESE